jgi:hypothetical protein
MPSSVLREREALAQKVLVTADELFVELVDGRTVSIPVQWYPRLAHGSTAERQNWQIIGRGAGIHWPDLDEDIAVEDLLAGRASGESQPSFQRWLQSRQGLANKTLQPTSRARRKSKAQKNPRAARG